MRPCRPDRGAEHQDDDERDAQRTNLFRPPVDAAGVGDRGSRRARRLRRSERSTAVPPRTGPAGRTAAPSRRARRRRPARGGRCECPGASSSVIPRRFVRRRRNASPVMGERAGAFPDVAVLTTRRQVPSGRRNDVTGHEGWYASGPDARQRRRVSCSRARPTVRRCARRRRSSTGRTRTDPHGPVTYTVQYVVKGATCNFAPATTVSGLTNSNHQPSLANNTYCWRVLAVRRVRQRHRLHGGMDVHPRQQPAEHCARLVRAAGVADERDQRELHVPLDGGARVADLSARCACSGDVQQRFDPVRRSPRAGLAHVQRVRDRRGRKRRPVARDADVGRRSRGAGHGDRHDAAGVVVEHDGRVDVPRDGDARNVRVQARQRRIHGVVRERCVVHRPCQRQPHLPGRATDAAGNTDATPAMHSWTVSVSTTSSCALCVLNPSSSAAVRADRQLGRERAGWRGRELDEQQCDEGRRQRVADRERARSRARRHRTASRKLGTARQPGAGERGVDHRPVRGGADVPRGGCLSWGSATNVSVGANKTSTINPGVYGKLEVTGNGVLSLNPGVYVITTSLKVGGTGGIVGNGVTLYFVCSANPTACGVGKAGAMFQLTGTGTMQPSPSARDRSPASHPVRPEQHGNVVVSGNGAASVARSTCLPVSSSSRATATRCEPGDRRCREVERQQFADHSAVTVSSSCRSGPPGMAARYEFVLSLSCHVTSSVTVNSSAASSGCQLRTLRNRNSVVHRVHDVEREATSAAPRRSRRSRLRTCRRPRAASCRRCWPAIGNRSSGSLRARPQPCHRRSRRGACRNLRQSG